MGVSSEAAIKHGQGAEAENHVEEEMQLRTNPEVEKKIAEYKEANPRETEYFTKLVQQNPERAVNFHFLQKQRQHEADTKAAMRQMPQAQAIYGKMSSQWQERVQERLENLNKYNHTKRFVTAVCGEINRPSMAQNRRMMTAPITKADLAAKPGATTPDAPTPSAPPVRQSVA